MRKIKLLGKSLEELKQIAISNSLPAFVGKQMADWIYVKKVRDIMDMKNISIAARSLLKENYEIGLMDFYSVQESVDGTKKYLFEVDCSHSGGLNRYEKTLEAGLEKSMIEAVMIPDGDRKTLCVSSQAGCKMGCMFCMTGRQGFHGHLSVADILSQVFAIEEAGGLTNIVFMGMGEPLDNYENVKAAIDAMTAPWGCAASPKRITLSTIGVLPYLKKYLDETKCHIAISLHNPFGEERSDFMPIQKTYPIADVLSLLSQYDFTGQRRVSFEYTMFAGVNDDNKHATALAALLKGLECRVNLIRFHQIPDFPYKTSSDEVIEKFKRRLEGRGIVTTIRASRGEDIFAACGMLAGRNKKKSN